MKIHDPNSAMVLVQNLKAGMRVEPGFLAEEETVIEQDAELVFGTSFYCVPFRTPDGAMHHAHPYNGDAVWVFPG